jgi:branched-subunit amino acid aminotransferase/4-amino-4-deoxychorismate lyase
MRRQVLSAARRLGYAVEERDLSFNELFAADEAFITNSLIEILPIDSVEGRALARGDKSEQLRRAVESIYEEENP